MEQKYKFKSYSKHENGAYENYETQFVWARETAIKKEGNASEHIPIRVHCESSLIVSLNIVTSYDLFRLSQASWQRLKRVSSDGRYGFNYLESIRTKSCKSYQAKALVKLAVKPPQKRVTINKLRDLIQEKLHEAVGYKEIQTFLKSELMFSYK